MNEKPKQKITDDLDHSIFSDETPLRQDAFKLRDQEKIRLISEHFHEIMEIMGLDMTDDSLKDTPERVAKMFVNESFSGLNPQNKPAVSLFKNKYQYGEMLLEKNISMFSVCEHHFQPFYGQAHIAYIPGEHVIGLSKLNRIVEYYASRPQVQERLTVQISNELKDTLKIDDIAVMIEAKHHCVSARGVSDPMSTTVTSKFSGKFQDKTMQNQFFSLLKK